MGPTFSLLFQLGSFIDFLSLILVVMGGKKKVFEVVSNLVIKGKTLSKSSASVTENNEVH